MGWGIRQAGRRWLHRVRRFNRRWIDWLDPDPRPQTQWAPVESRARAPTPTVSAAPIDRAPVEIQWRETPNPDARRFSANVPLLTGGSVSLSNARAAETHPIGRALFAIPGVQSVFATPDFAAVTRTPDASWLDLTPAICDALIAAVNDPGEPHDA
jgi:hypothetical protein